MIFIMKLNNKNIKKSILEFLPVQISFRQNPGYSLIDLYQSRLFVLLLSNCGLIILLTWQLPSLLPRDEEMLHGHIQHTSFSNPSFFEVSPMLLCTCPA